MVPLEQLEPPAHRAFKGLPEPLALPVLALRAQPEPQVESEQLAQLEPQDLLDQSDQPDPEALEPRVPLEHKGLQAKEALVQRERLELSVPLVQQVRKDSLERVLQVPQVRKAQQALEQSDTQDQSDRKEMLVIPAPLELLAQLVEMVALALLGLPVPLVQQEPDSLVLLGLPELQVKQEILDRRAQLVPLDRMADPALLALRVLQVLTETTVQPEPPGHRVLLETPVQLEQLVLKDLPELQVPREPPEL